MRAIPRELVMDSFAKKASSAAVKNNYFVIIIITFTTRLFDRFPL